MARECLKDGFSYEVWLHMTCPEILHAKHESKETHSFAVTMWFVTVVLPPGLDDPSRDPQLCGFPVQCDPLKSRAGGKFRGWKQVPLGVFWFLHWHSRVLQNAEVVLGFLLEEQAFVSTLWPHNIAEE